MRLFQRPSISQSNMTYNKTINLFPPHVKARLSLVQYTEYSGQGKQGYKQMLNLEGRTKRGRGAAEKMKEVLGSRGRGQARCASVDICWPSGPGQLHGWILIYRQKWKEKYWGFNGF